MEPIAISSQKQIRIPQSSHDPSVPSSRHRKPKAFPSHPAMPKQKSIARRSCKLSAVLVAATGHSSRPGVLPSWPVCSCRRADARYFVRSPGCRTEMDEVCGCSIDEEEGVVWGWCRMSAVAFVINSFVLGGVSSLLAEVARPRAQRHLALHHHLLAVEHPVAAGRSLPSLLHDERGDRALRHPRAPLIG